MKNFFRTADDELVQLFCRRMLARYKLIRRPDCDILGLRAYRLYQTDCFYSSGGLIYEDEVRAIYQTTKEEEEKI